MDCQGSAWQVLHFGQIVMRGDLYDRVSWLGQPCGSHFSSLSRAQDGLGWGLPIGHPANKNNSDIEIIETPKPPAPSEVAQLVSSFESGWKIISGRSGGLEQAGTHDLTNGNWPGDYRYWCNEYDAILDMARIDEEAKVPQWVKEG